ncbi:MAG: hypothetical protein QGF99_10175 [Acidimicrobiales bacterium]|nr:hypothetical protein [Acidimicrobiales bacterium]MDP6902343.1 hypothetical protein [Acidimicrobiales bacterium]HJL98556.1 hypothetical protein [Acidimicrobiales bacterium]
MDNDRDSTVESSAPLTEGELDGYEIEFSKVESTLRALADGTDPVLAASWVNET